MVPYISVNPANKEILVVADTQLNSFMTTLGLKGDDVILAFNDVSYSLDNIYDLITVSQNWQTDDPISVKIKRQGNEQIITGKIKLDYEDEEGLKFNDDSKKTLNNSWLKG